MSSDKPRKIELLAPARDADIAITAINHGADAVYIGPENFGARSAAGNSIPEIQRVVDYAHQFRCRVYVTVNTIIFEHELSKVERLIKDLYKVGVDAIIVQDMGILRLDIPPIELHASTQCYTRTVAKSRFLQDVGFSQIVLARELGIGEIKRICDSVTIPVETFIHGALCVSYSGRCHASYATTGRSANRGACAQICRLPYDLVDTTGNVIAKNKHLLSLKDFNASDRLVNLLDAGVSSFKIEGRLKDEVYVKNVTAYYRQLLDKIINSSEGRFERSSCGESRFTFTPQLTKSFNRGFTHYFLDNRRPKDIASLLTPKSLGEPITDVNKLNNGDGISYFDEHDRYTGGRVNRVDKGRIITSSRVNIRKNTSIYRTFDVVWEKMLARETAERRMWLDIKITKSYIRAIDERGCSVSISILDLPREKAKRPLDLIRIFEKLGNTIYYLRNFDNQLSNDIFIPVSRLTAKRRELVNLLDKVSRTTYQYQYRCKENRDACMTDSKGEQLSVCDFRENISNSYAKMFYEDHGFTMIESALETLPNKSIPSSTILMTCRHCILRELDLCKQVSRNKEILSEPLYIVFGDKKFRLDFDCTRCEMRVLKY